MRKRIILFILILTLMMCSFVFVNAGIEYRRPVQNYYSVQNPPDFSWRHTAGATYDLVVASDPELSDVKYKAEGLKKNIYNFTECTVKCAYNHFILITSRNGTSFSYDKRR